MKLYAYFISWKGKEKLYVCFFSRKGKEDYHTPVKIFLLKSTQPVYFSQIFSLHCNFQCNFQCNFKYNFQCNFQCTYSALNCLYFIFVRLCGCRGWCHMLICTLLMVFFPGKNEESIWINRKTNELQLKSLNKNQFMISLFSFFHSILIVQEHIFNKSLSGTASCSVFVGSYTEVNASAGKIEFPMLYHDFSCK